MPRSVPCAFRAHSLTMAYIEKFELKTNDFTMDNPNGYLYMGGNKVRASEAHANPALLGFDVAEKEKGKTASQMYMKSIQPLLDMLEKDGDAAWPELVAKHDQYSTREFLEREGWSEGMIEMFGLLANQESVMNSSFLEMFREDAGNYYTNMVEIHGGTDRLPHAFLPELKDNIRFGAKMIAMDQSPTDVTIHYQTAAGRFSEKGDYAIIAVPFPVLRHVEVLKPFTRQGPLHSPTALRRLGEDPLPVQAALLGGRRRHLRWRHAHRSSDPQPLLPRPWSRDRPRVILASYTWSEDAQRWGSLKPNDRIVQALEDVAEIHPQITQEFEVGVSWMWHDDEFAGGAFALFDPGQQTLLQDQIVKPEGRIYFAGEHASSYHAWIQGALESGIRAAVEIHSQ